MMIFLSAVIGLALWAVAATVVVVLRDGYRQVPTRVAEGVGEWEGPDRG